MAARWDFVHLQNQLDGIVRNKAIYLKVATVLGPFSTLDPFSVASSTSSALSSAGMAKCGPRAACGPQRVFACCNHRYFTVRYNIYAATMRGLHSSGPLQDHVYFFFSKCRAKLSVAQYHEHRHENEIYVSFFAVSYDSHMNR